MQCMVADGIQYRKREAPGQQRTHYIIKITLLGLLDRVQAGEEGVQRVESQLEG